MGLIGDFFKVMTEENKWTPVEGKLYKYKKTLKTPLGWNNPDLPYIENVQVYCDFSNGKRVPCTFKCYDGCCEIHLKNKIFKYDINSVSFEKIYKREADTTKIFVVKVYNPKNYNDSSTKYSLIEGVNYK